MGGGKNGLADRLRRIDMHSSVMDEFRVRTSQGAALSLFTIIAILYLTHTEMKFNLNPTVVDRVHVQRHSPSGLEVEFDVTFPNIPCALLSIDAADPTGQPQSLHIDRSHRVWKHRLDKEGKEIGRRSKFEMGSTLHSEERLKEMTKEMFPDLLEKKSSAKRSRDLISADQEEECGSCYGAGEEGECCNTCDDVKRAYRRRGWQIQDLEKVSVCRKSIKAAEEADEGCNVHGLVALSTGGGNLHIAPGRFLEQFGHENELTFHDILVSAFDMFNMTHTVNKLHFGKDFPGNTYQLDGKRRVIQDDYVMYQYYFQIVPTLYKYLNGTSIQTNQFSVTEHKRLVNPGLGRGLPGLYFYYEVSPLHVEFEEYRLGWIRFFTSICAVVGGVFTVMGMFDSYLYSRAKGGGRSRLG